MEQNGKNKKESSSLTEWSGAVGSSPNDLLTFSIYTPTLLATHSALHRSVCMHTHTHTQLHTAGREVEIRKHVADTYLNLPSSAH